MKNPYIKSMNYQFNRIEEMARRGLITLREANERMIDEIDIARENWRMNDCPGEWDTQTAYHKMYLILAKLTRD